MRFLKLQDESSAKQAQFQQWREPPHLSQPVGLDGRDYRHVHEEDAEKDAEHERGVAQENLVVQLGRVVLHLARVGGQSGGHRQPEVDPSALFKKVSRWHR